MPVPCYRAALRALTQLVALVHTLEDGTLRLRLCQQNQGLLEDLRQDVAASFTGLAGIVSGHGSGAPALRLCEIRGCKLPWSVSHSLSSSRGGGSAWRSCDSGIPGALLRRGACRNSIRALQWCLMRQPDGPA